MKDGMAATNQHAHQLLDELAPTQLAAVVHLLEAILSSSDEEEIGAEERQAIANSQEYFAQGNEGLTFEQVVAECGFTMDQIRRSNPVE